MRVKIILIHVLLPVLAIGQSSSENFLMSSSVLDASGLAYVSESFQMVSTVGQPTPIGAQISESFILYSGFLHPQFLVSPLSPIQELVIKENQPDVNLYWEEIVGAASYSIHRDTIVVFMPDGSNLIGTSETNSYIDTGITTTAAEKYFYIVISSLSPPTISSSANDGEQWKQSARRCPEIRNR